MAIVCVLVEVVIKEDMVDEFLKVIAEDSAESLKEPGCLRFDVMADKSQKNKFSFYEAYKDTDAAAYHKTTAHYKLWSDFKAKGAVLSQEVTKYDGLIVSQY
mmetsp:Transcript_12373/g.15027  ORF Transcript_12373/g.15027 Transcript_12373/m.15027 type:complete len:102 (+) Transcript_12373:117-422(+)